MDFLNQALEGFQSLQADPALKDRGAQNLKRWLTDDEFLPYRPQIQWLIQERQWAGLLDRFYQILPFGTGGRRGNVGVGPNRMNLWTLGASVQGHCEYLRERFPDIETLKVALAYDVRQFEDKNKRYNPNLPNPVLHLSSKTFAQYAASVYVANGIHAHILPENSTRYLATPELSFIIRQLGAHGGLNVSASHNPPDDNGGKFYDERGGQPVPPDDQIMADLVELVGTIKTLPWPEAVRSGKVHWLTESFHKGYIDLCRKQSLVKPPRFDEIQVVYSPLHGVGSMTAMEVLVDQGFRVRPVEEQMKPDGQFPNVTQTPNPEVPASMDLAALLAESCQADLVLATDPDADRLGAMIPGPEGKFQFVDGNTLAALLAYFKLSKLTELGAMPANPILAKTIVTTSLVTRIGRHFQAQVVDNLLVGFKYVAEVLWQLESTGKYGEIVGSPADFVLACEESHGILAMPALRDKDAGAAALLCAELALDCKRRGKSMVQYLDDLHRKFGYFKNDIRNLVMPGIEGKQLMARMLSRMRADPPKTLAGLEVTAVEDLLDENGFLGPYKGNTDRGSRNFLIFHLGDRGKVALRPSGTEPKAKAYIELASEPFKAGTTATAWQERCREIDRRHQELAEEFVALAMGLTK